MVEGIRPPLKIYVTSRRGKGKGMQMKFNLSGTILRIVGEERRLSIRLPREKLKNARVPPPRLVHLTARPSK